MTGYNDITHERKVQKLGKNTKGEVSKDIGGAVGLPPNYIGRPGQK